ncbi:MAG: hypothetical protein Salg2KO_05600 [Salibacteraceae bacterium]
MANSNIAVVNPLWINAMNPSSYTSITKPTFNFDIKDEFLSLTSGNTTQGSNAFSIQNFSFAFPIINNSKKFKRRMGFSFGLAPYTTSGYELFFSEDVPDLGEVEYHFFGEGGINKLNGGLGYDLFANKKRTDVLSIGVNGQYIFGNISRNRATQLERAALGSSLYRTSSIEISDIGVNAGIRYYHTDTIKRRIVLSDSTIRSEDVLIMASVGAFIEPSMSLNTSARQVEYTYTDSFQRPNIIDTIIEASSRGETNIPLAFGVGLSLNIDNAWTLALDYRLTQWSTLVINGTNAGLNDASRVSLGADWVPEFDKRGRGNYHKVIRYRLGGSLEQTMLNVGGLRPLRYGINFGLGFPLSAASASTSMFNIGAEVARRQTEGLSLNENIVNIHAGFIITPHRYDQWFAKRKYD